MKPFDVYSIFDIEITRASGSELWDRTGRRYLDMYGGHAVISVGHGHPAYVEAITRQLQAVGFYSNSVKIGLQEVLAHKLGESAGYPEYGLFLCNSGAEANENAFKLASFHTGRKKIIAFGGAFHGRTSLAVAATDNPAIVAPVNATDNVVFLPLNDEAALEARLTDDVAAVIVEGIQGVAGVRIPTVSFLQKAQALCQKHGALLILDEVQSGYGRSGRFFAHAHAGIRPDLVTVAKGMGNGFPVAGVLVAPHIAARKEMLGTTFGGNHLACAAAIAVLDIIEAEGLVHHARRMGDYLAQALQGLPSVAEVRSLGLMTGIELQAPCGPVRETLLREYGIFTGSSSNKHTLRILPALNVTHAHVDEFVTALRQTLEGGRP